MEMNQIVIHGYSILVIACCECNREGIFSLGVMNEWKCQEVYWSKVG